MKLAAMIVLVTLAACARQQHDPAATAATSTPPAFIVARGRVDVEGGPLPLALSVDGVVDRVGVAEGDVVKRGQWLVTTDPTPARLDRKLAQAHLDQAQAQVGLLRAKASAARMRAVRLTAAAKQDAGDGQSADDAREAAVEAVAELDNARAGTRIASADLQRADYLATQHILRAPVDGEVLRVTVWPGMRVSAQAGTLVTLLPSKARIVRAEVSQDFIAAIQAGDSARIVSDDGRQTPLGGAHVLRVGRTYGQSALQEDPLQRVNERSVECVLAFDETTSLRVGQRVLVRFPTAASLAAERLAKPRPRTL